MERKLNKKKVIICILLIIILFVVPTFGRYVCNNIRDMYLRSQNFSFSSNLLSTTQKTYSYSNWDGIEDYVIALDLYSYKYKNSLIDYDGLGLKYYLECEVSDENKAKCYITSDVVTGEQTALKKSTQNSYIPDETNIKNLFIHLVPGSDLAVGDIIQFTVTAKSTSPYEKTISAKFKIEISEPNVNYEIIDEPNSLYATLKLVNTKPTLTEITLTYDPTIVLIDKLSEVYPKDTANIITKKISNIDYVSGIKFSIQPEQTQNIKFYKADKSKDYTYRVGSSEQMIITVKESN